MVRRSIYKIQEEVVLAKLILEPPFEVNLESLNGEIRILYVVKGHSVLRTPTKTIKLYKGDTAIINSGNIINNWIVQQDNKTAEVILIRLSPNVVKDLFGDIISSFLQTEKQTAIPVLPAYKINPNSVFKKYIDGLYLYFDKPDLLKETLVKIKLREFVFLLINLKEKNTVHNVLKNLFNPIEHKFSEIINTHLFENISLEELTHLCDLSLSSFNRKFKKIYNESPKKYILNKRLHKAKELLSRSELRISEIAFDCCFEDPTHFSKSFSSLFGISPSEYRKSISQ